MLSGKRGVTATLLLLGLLFMAGNLFVTLGRSTILWKLDTTVVAKEIGREKHPGLDDVHWLVIDDGSRLHVDGVVWEQVREGDRLRKDRFSSELLLNDVLVPLSVSGEFCGMVVVVGGLLIVVIVLRGSVGPSYKSDD